MTSTPSWFGCSASSRIRPSLVGYLLAIHLLLLATITQPHSNTNYPRINTLRTDGISPQLAWRNSNGTPVTAEGGKRSTAQVTGKWLQRMKTIVNAITLICRKRVCVYICPGRTFRVHGVDGTLPLCKFRVVLSTSYNHIGIL